MGYGGRPGSNLSSVHFFRVYLQGLQQRLAVPLQNWIFEPQPTLYWASLSSMIHGLLRLMDAYTSALKTVKNAPESQFHCENVALTKAVI